MAIIRNGSAYPAALRTAAVASVVSGVTGKATAEAFNVHPSTVQVWKAAAGKTNPSKGTKAYHAGLKRKAAAAVKRVNLNKATINTDQKTGIITVTYNGITYK